MMEGDRTADCTRTPVHGCMRATFTRISCLNLHHLYLNRPTTSALAEARSGARRDGGPPG